MHFQVTALQTFLVTMPKKHVDIRIRFSYVTFLQKYFSTNETNFWFLSYFWQEPENYGLNDSSICLHITSEFSQQWSKYCWYLVRTDVLSFPLLPKMHDSWNNVCKRSMRSLLKWKYCSWMKRKNIKSLIHIEQQLLHWTFDKQGRYRTGT